MPKISTTPNAELMTQAREALQGKWSLAVGVFLVLIVILCGVQAIPEAGPFLPLILSGPFSVGLAIFSLALSRGEQADMQQLFSGFQKHFGVSVAAYILVGIFVLLWTLLLIIPGIIAAMSYSMTYYIIADENETDPFAAIKKSKKMMDGNKWKLACLSARFIGWMLLCILTFGIGYFWLGPYMNISYAKFYDDLKEADDQKKLDYLLL